MDRSGRIRAARFDCYGTLVDWEGGAGGFLYALWRRLGESEPPPGRLLRERWERIQFDVIAGPYLRYADVLRESLHRLFEEHRLPWEESHAAAFADAMRSWQPFPDTLPALRRARAAGLRLMIVSNTDRDIMAHTLRQLEVPFDLVQIAEDVEAYKPSSVPFTAALEHLGLPPDEVLHVAFGFERGRPG
jgi:2-haloacid dehalogenase